MKGKPKPTDFWAKLEYRDHDRSTGDIVAWHPLLAHSAEVAAVTEALLTRTILGKRLASLVGLGELSEVHVARLSALAAIHDAGKVNHSFQNQAFDRAGRSQGHVRPIVQMIDSEIAPKWLIHLNVMDLLKWFPSDEELLYFLLATWGHHGLPVAPDHDFRSDLWKDDGARDPVAGLRQLAAATRTWFPNAFDSPEEQFPLDPALQHAFNGVLTLADWIGSDTRFFPFVDDVDDPMPEARSKAAKAIEALFLDADVTRTHLGNSPIGFRGILDEAWWTPHPVQRACLDLPLHADGSLTILESDTGSGKTEAAIARFTRLFQAGLVDGMYFAVPTRSAATQLHTRITRIVERVFPAAQRPPVVQAVPGYIKTDDKEGTRLPHFRVQWDDPGMPPDRGWASEHSKRYLAGPIVVGTVDQVLLSTLQVKHAHMRAAALLRHFLVVDEVHASDVYMTALMDRVIDQHLASGGHVMLMSATLGSGARFHLATNGRQDPPPPVEAEAIDYPLLTHVDSKRVAPESTHAASSGYEKKVQIDHHGIAGNPVEIARMAARHAGAGARVLVIRNLVRECIDVQRAVEEEVGEEVSLLLNVDDIPAPHHSRFAPEDRKRLDEAIEDAFGKKVTGRGVVAVCTQTVEQSLDIDADLLITDLCPMDVLLQRIGRLHRHDLRRPAGFETARCVVVTPAERDLSLAITRDGKALGPHGLGTVYGDLRVIEATWRIIEDSTIDTWVIPSHNRRLVERATHVEHLHDIVREVGGSWVEHEQLVLGERMADAMISHMVSLEADQPFGEELFDPDFNPRTRLGINDYRVELPQPATGPFGKTVNAFTISSWRLPEGASDGTEAEDIVQFEDGLQFSVSGTHFRYSRLGLEV